jgi:hypothetical protein
MVPTDESIYGARARTLQAVQTLCARRPHCMQVHRTDPLMISFDAGSGDDDGRAVVNRISSLTVLINAACPA